MSLIQGFEHDVFISYAYRDNENISEGHDGWVDSFSRSLRIRLMELLGESVRIWFDKRLVPHDQMSGKIRSHLSKSAILIAIISPAYLRSSYCLKELSEFSQQRNLLVDGYSRIVKVVKTYVPLDEHPPMLNELLGYEFYEYDPVAGRLREFNPEIAPSHDVRYWERLNDLAWDIKNLLAHMAKRVSEQSVQVMPSVKRNQVFVSYSHKDIKWLERIQVHLKPLEKLGTIKRWDDTLIKPGAKWREEIREGLESARVAVLIISADFLASDFIMTDELPPLLTAAEQEGAAILPLIASPCRFEDTDSLSQFQAVNPPSKPLNAMMKPKREEVFVKLAKLIENALRS